MTRCRKEASRGGRERGGSGGCTCRGGGCVDEAEKGDRGGEEGQRCLRRLKSAPPGPTRAQHHPTPRTTGDDDRPRKTDDAPSSHTLSTSCSPSARCAQSVRSAGWPSGRSRTPSWSRIARESWLIRASGGGGRADGEGAVGPGRVLGTSKKPMRAGSRRCALSRAGDEA